MRRSFRIVLILACLLVGLYIIYGGRIPWLQPFRHDIAKEVFGGKDHMRTVASAPFISAHRLHIKGEEPQFFDSWKLANYNQTEDVTLSVAPAAKLREILLSRWSYGYGYVKACMPQYGVLFVFHGTDEEIKVALCFHCRQIGIFHGEQPLNKIREFDPCEPQLRELAKQIFPQDVEIQNLK